MAATTTNLFFDFIDGQHNSKEQFAFALIEKFMLRTEAFLSDFA